MYEPEEYEVFEKTATRLKMIREDGEHAVDIPIDFDAGRHLEFGRSIIALMNLAYERGKVTGRRELGGELRRAIGAADES